MSKTNIIIFTDLDGCLLDHHDYSFDLARPILSRLKQNDIPLIINSSKTHLEVEKIQQEIGINTPYIIENGAAVIFNPFSQPDQFPTDDQLMPFENKTIKNFSIARTELLSISNQIKKQFNLKYQGFNEMCIEQVSALTQLTREQAFRAKQRGFSEPVLWHDTQSRLVLFEKMLNEKGISLQAGGRFLHLTSQCNKGNAMQWLLNQWQFKDDENKVVIALGDSKNDKSMLDNSDYAIVIKNQNVRLEVNGRIQTIYSSLKGTAGWVETLTCLLNQIQPEQEKTYG